MLRRSTAFVLVATLLCTTAHSQTKRLPPRAKPPSLEKSRFQGIFFSDVRQSLSGEFPEPASSSTGSNNNPSAAGLAQAGNVSNGTTASSNGLGWELLISSQSLEDLVKGSKLRLDRIITTPTAFAGGGYNEARREFSLLALLFAIIEHYPNEVRWKASAATARASMERTAANAKIGSRQVFDEAKKRLQDLQTVLDGATLAAEPKSEVIWENLIDISPLMKTLDWSYQQQLNKMVATPEAIQQNQDDILRLSELIRVLGKVAIVENMPNADDQQFVELAQQMIEAAGQIKQAVENGNADLARTASGRLGQACVNCHDKFN